MKLKLRLMFLLGGLLIVPPNFIFSSKFGGGEHNVSEYSMQRRGDKHDVHITLQVNRGHKRSVLSSYGYVENNTLYLYFSSPLENASLDITNVDTGTLVFSGEFTGTSLVIPLEYDGNEFIIDIN